MDKEMNKKTGSENCFDLLILGSGPAGCSAAIYAARANLNCAMLSGTDLGGQLSRAAKIANWPGSNGVAGATLMEEMLEHVRALAVEIIYDSVTSVDLSKAPFIVNCGDVEYFCKTLIIATGSYPRLLGLSSEQVYLGKGVSTCATCDGFFYRDKEVAIVGGGNAMASTAFYISQLAKKVHIIHHTDKFRVEPIELTRLQELANVEFHYFTEVTEFVGNEKLLSGLKLHDLKTGSETLLEVDGCFLSIGHLPNTKMFKHQIDLKDDRVLVGYNGVNTQCSVDGVFAAGDLVYGLPQQAIVAAGWGCMAALDAAKYLYNLKEKE